MLARATSWGSTPARCRRTTVRASPTGRCRAPLPANTFAPRYSTLPESSAASVTTRNPSRRLARTSTVRESMTRPVAGTRIAQFPPRPSCSAMRAPTSVALASTIAIRFGPPPRPSCPEKKKTTPNSTGPSSAPIQNHRVRTRSTNSRRTIAQILRIGSYAGLGRLRADQIDEDLQERWLAQLEARQPRPRRDQVAQDALWVRSWGELDLGVLTVVIDLFHERCVGEDPCRRADAAVESDHEMVSAPGVLDVAEWAIHQLPPARDDAHVLAQFLRLFHDMVENRMVAPRAR